MLLLARDGAPEGSWLRAERQTAGRGRQGRAWDSPIGNLHASTVVRVRAGDPPAATLALVAGIAVEEVATVHLGDHRHPGSVPVSRMREAAGRGDWLNPPALQLKWPNDLLLGGAKVAGILLERAQDGVVIGVGANVVHHPALERTTTSMAEHGVEISAEAFLETLAETFGRWLSRWRSEGLAPVRARWLERAHPVGTALTARLPDGSAIDGLFDGLDHDGALMLRLAGGQRRVIHAGDVFLL